MAKYYAIRIFFVFFEYHYLNKKFLYYLNFRKKIVLKLLLFLLLLSLSFSSSAQSSTFPQGFVEEPVASGWTAPVGLAFSKNGTRMYVWEKAGRVWIVENGVKASNPLIDINEEVGDWGDHGLLGFAIDPSFDTNGYIYLLYTVDRHHLLHFGTGSYSPSANAYRQASIGRLTRYTVSPGNNRTTVDLNSRKILIGETKATGIPILYESHGMGALVFGEDGSLLVSTGDGASAGGVDYGYVEGDTDPNRAQDTYARQALEDGIITQNENVGAFKAQMVESLNGKILRIDPGTGNGLPTNPFYDTANPKSSASRVWALGFRNPFRFTVKPGTGGAAFPGVIYTGDTGWQSFEEINVVHRGGMNFGWPLYEGLEEMPYYMHRAIGNPYAPNPMYGQGNCDQQFVTFQDLLKQPKKSGQPYFHNMCRFEEALSDDFRKFTHARPAIEWGNGSGGSRTGTFVGEEAAVVKIGAPGSPVAGPQFNGSSPTGGVWYTGADFPEAYRNTYFFGDYGAAWIKNASFDGADDPKEVRPFKSSNAVVVGFATNPVTGGLYYVDYIRGVQKIAYYDGNRPPVAVASADRVYGASPLAVTFKGTDSSDPDGDALTYEWDFGDGTVKSTAASPVHTYTSTQITSFEVTLKVTDPSGLSSTAKLKIFLNNTPPVVRITSPARGTSYALGRELTYDLRAAVTDAEHTGSQLAYEWQTVLHHNNHTHPEPVDAKRETTTTITPMGCDGEDYFYRIHLTVKDAGGLAGKDSVDITPDCSGGIVKAVVVSSPLADAVYAIGAPINLQVRFTDPSRVWSKVAFYQNNIFIGEATAAPYSFTWHGAEAGMYSITARAIDHAEHALDSDPVNIVVGDGAGSNLAACLAGVQHYFGLDETAAGAYADYASATAGVCTDCPAAVAGKFGGAQRFSSTGSGININSASRFNWGKDVDFTFEMWVRTSATAGRNSVIIGRNDAASDLHWWIGTSPEGKAMFMLKDINHVGIYIGDKGPALNDGQWHHLVAIRNGTSKISELYVDGAMVDEAQYFYENGFVGQSAVTLGYMELDHGYHFSGDLDEVMLYNRALTAAEITGRYNGGAGSYCGPDPLAAKKAAKFDGAFEVFPNPWNGGKVAVFASSLSASKTVELVLTDMTGKKVAVHQAEANADGTLQTQLIPAMKVRPGLYHLTLKTESKSISRKLVVLE